jgi:hypothetical protein
MFTVLPPGPRSSFQNTPCKNNTKFFKNPRGVKKKKKKGIAVLGFVSLKKHCDGWKRTKTL